MEESPRRIESQSNRMTPFPFDAIALTIKLRDYGTINQI
jgi:hypothetical protein